MAKIITSQIVAKAYPFITQFKPSPLIPFKGDFPLLRPYKQEEFDKGIETMYIDECPEWIQEILFKGERMWAIENGFKEYLKDNGIFDDFMIMKSDEKATELIRFFNANSLTLDSLKI